MHKYESNYAKVAEARLSLSLDPGSTLVTKTVSYNRVEYYFYAFIIQPTNVSRVSKTE